MCCPDRREEEAKIQTWNPCVKRNKKIPEEHRASHPESSILSLGRILRLFATLLVIHTVALINFMTLSSTGARDL